MFNALKCYVIFVIFILSNAHNTLGQQSLLHTKITLQADSSSIKNIIQSIENNESIPFFYNDKLLPSPLVYNIHYINISLEIILNDIFKEQTIGFKELNGGIVLYKEKKQPQKFALFGTISDKHNGENLIGVSVYDSTWKHTVVSNNFGYYSLSLKEGSYRIKASYIGYQSIDTLIHIHKNTLLNLNLALSDVLLNEINVTAHDRNDNVHSLQMNTATLYMKDIRNLPGMFGENDVVQNLSVLPGVQQADIADGGVYVRGGSSDQTVFMMDEGPIYSPSHFGGLFSAFNPDIINTVEIIKGDMPVSNEGAISSVVNVHLREGDNQKWRFKGDLGLISFKGLIEGPIKKDKGSVLLSFRRSYIDMLLKIPNLKVEPALSYHFYDLNFKANYKTSPKDRFYVSGYSGSDNLSILGHLIRNNNMLNFRWNHIYKSSIFSNTSAVFSRNFMEQYTNNSEAKMRWKRYIYNFQIKHDLNFYLNKNFTLKAGLSANGYNINPYQVSVYNTISEDNIENGQNEYLYVAGSYFSVQSSIKNQFSFNIGFRVNYNLNPKAYLHNGEATSGISTNKEQFSWLTFEPRIVLKYQIDTQTALKAGFNRQANAMHQLRITETGMAVNRWMPATQSFLPQLSNNFSLGVHSKLSKHINFEVEAYLRTMHNLIETMHNADILVKEKPDEYLYKAKGKATGLESALKFKFDKITAFANYTLSKAMWQTNDINQNNWYPAYHDRPHSINISAAIKLKPNISLSAAWIYSTGAPYTNVVGKYTLNNKPMVSFDTEKINANRLPDYHRLDLSMDIASKKNDKRRWKSFWNFSIYNAYFHKNPYSILYFSPINNEADNINYHLNPQYLYFYQFIPSVTYKFEF